MLASTSTRAPTSIAELIPPDLAARLESLDVFSRKVLAGKLQGERRSKRRGRSVEFDDYREYVAGDDLRYIDWNVFARLDRFFIKVFQEEEDLGLHLVLDASASMNAGSPNKLLFAARLAAALGYIGLVNNNRVSLTVFGTSEHLKRLEPLRGRRNVQRLVQFVLDHAFAPAPSAGEAPTGEFSAALRAIAGSSSGKGVVVLLSDLLIPPPDGYQPGLRLLAGAAARTGGGLDGYVIQVLSPGEIDPAREGRAADPDSPDSAEPAGRDTPFIGDLRLTDAETGRVAEVTVTRSLLEQYRRSVQTYIREAADYCTARGLSHALALSDTDVGALILDTLRHRGMLK